MSNFIMQSVHMDVECWVLRCLKLFAANSFYRKIDGCKTLEIKLGIILFVLKILYQWIYILRSRVFMSRKKWRNILFNMSNFQQAQNEHRRLGWNVHILWFINNIESFWGQNPLICLRVLFLYHTLGKSCHIWQFLKVSIELRMLAVLWTHFCVDKTADLSSFMDTFSMSKKLPDLGSSMDTFPTQ